MFVICLLMIFGQCGKRFSVFMYQLVVPVITLLRRYLRCSVRVRSAIWP